MSTGTEAKPHWDVAAIRERVAIPDVCGRLGIELKRAGGGFSARCPFHEERTASFSVTMKGGEWLYHCFGCGVGGDVIALWQGVRGCDFLTACGELAGMCGLGPMVAGGAWKPTKPRKVAPQVKDWRPLPVMRRLSEGTMGELSGLRGVSVDGVRLAESRGLVRGALLGVSVRGGLVWGSEMEGVWARGDLAVGPVRCWLVTDESRVCAQARRLDGKPWRRRDGSEFKAWTIGTSTWPLGVMGLGAFPAVAVVEGGPDILAMCDVVARGGWSQRVGVVAMLGASVRWREDALLRLMGKRVRIFPHTDKVDAKRGTQAGYEGARRWREQITAAGWAAAVDEWRLPLPAGTTGDVNDAVRMGGEIGDALTEAVGEMAMVDSETAYSPPSVASPSVPPPGSPQPVVEEAAGTSEVLATGDLTTGN